MTDGAVCGLLFVWTLNLVVGLHADWTQLQKIEEEKSCPSACGARYVELTTMQVYFG
jgi:hypothetical protein